MTYSIDQYKNDQIMQLQYDQAGSDKRNLRSYGLKMWDRRNHFTLQDLVNADDSLKSLKDTAAYHAAFRKMLDEGLIGPQRLFLGKTSTKEFGLFINDNKGRPRIKIGLDSLNMPFFQALDTNAHSHPLYQ